MNISQVNVKLKLIWSVCVILCIIEGVPAFNEEYTLDNGKSDYDSGLTFVRLQHEGARVRRAAPAGDAPPPPAANATAAAVPAPAPTAATATATATATAPDATPNATEAGATGVAGAAVVTQTPLLGVNGSGTRNVTENTAKVSDPIVPDDNFDIFLETPEKIKAEQNLTNLTYDDHSFYNSSFIGNLTYFNEYWANISSPRAHTHAVLSNSHRRATTLQLSFSFPFYGNYIRNITVATGGFIYTGEHVHNWLAATQYIAPLMANFDTSLTNDSAVKLYDDGERFTAFWENVTLQENASLAFTFAATLRRNGDIEFAYRSVPLDIQTIDDAQHPVKVGISDAYLNDNILFYVRRKTIYEYHRVSFKNHGIASGTILRLAALPTCLQYDSCAACLRHTTGFNCTWCPQIMKCSSGTDRNKQDWKLRHCERTAVSDVAACGAAAAGGGASAGSDAAYETDAASAPRRNTPDVTEQPSAAGNASAVSGERTADAAGAGAAGAGAGGAVAAGAGAALLAAALWALYAFKNPHTRSGQLLIKYRPSQWSWKRGEARYTAATIHM